MDDNKEKLLTATTTPQSMHADKGFAKIRLLLEAAGGLSLSQVCTVAGLEGSTVQNWVKRGWVAHPNGKKYEETHIARILIINALKECIQLEHISLLMDYVNGTSDGGHGSMIKESDLYDYLCGALQQLGNVDDMPKGGVEAVVEKVIKDYQGPTESSRQRIRKALTIMIYACVCTDVKRRTEAMMGQVLRELDYPDEVIAEPTVDDGEEIEEIADDAQDAEEVETEKAGSASSEEARRTVAQAIREWDLARVESIIDEEDNSEEIPVSADGPGVNDAVAGKPVASEEKAAQKPWYFRRN